MTFTAIAGDGVYVCAFHCTEYTHPSLGTSVRHTAMYVLLIQQVIFAFISFQGWSAGPFFLCSPELKVTCFQVEARKENKENAYEN